MAESNAVKLRPSMTPADRLGIEYGPDMQATFDVLWAKCHRRLTKPPAAVDMVAAEELDIQHHSTQSIVIASWSQSDGTTTVSLGLAASAAAAGQGDVCLVDADFASPGLTAKASLDNRAGLRELLAGGVRLDDAAVRVGDSALWLLPSGRKNSTDVAPSDGSIQQTIGMLEERFRYVIFDAASLKAGALAYRWGRFVVNAVLVLKAGRTRQQVVAHAVASMRQHGMEILGTILSQRTDPIPAWLYPHL